MHIRESSKYNRPYILIVFVLRGILQHYLRVKSARFLNLA